MSTTETKPSIGCLKVASNSSPASVPGAVIDGEYRTAIRFAVEPRGAAAIAPIVDAAAVH